MAWQHPQGQPRLVMRLDRRGCLRRILPAWQVKTVFRVVFDVLDNLLRQSAPKQPMCLLWPCPAYTGKLWRGAFVSIQLAQPELAVVAGALEPVCVLDEESLYKVRAASRIERLEAHTGAHV